MLRAALPIITVIMTSFAVPVLAQSSMETPTARSDISAQLDARFKRLDRDGNGMFTRAELVLAQKEGQEQIGSRLRTMLSEEFVALDKNKDTLLNSAELAASRRGGKAPADTAGIFKDMDSNNDGMVSKAEYVVPASRVRAAANPDTQIAKFDLNKDGKVSLDEYKAGPLASFDAADFNKDGIVSPDEKKRVVAQRGR